MTNIKIIHDCEKKTSSFVPMSAAEIADRDQNLAAFAETQMQQKAEAEALAALKESAKAKLLAGEPLTEEETAVVII